MPLLDLVLPALDEEAALPWVLERVPDDVRAIVVDNGSTDRTAEVAAAHGALVVREPHRGFGAACAAGLAAATADLVGFCDADASISPGVVLHLAAMVEDGEADLVLGARQAEPGAWPPHARVANRYLAWRVGRATGARLTDLGPVRVARRTELIGLGIEDRRFGWPLEMVVRAANAGWRLAEVPVPYRPRVGRSKVTGTVRGTARAVRDMRVVLGDLA